MILNFLATVYYHFLFGWIPFNKVILPFRNVFRSCDSEGQMRSTDLEILFASFNTNDGTGHE